MSQPSRKCWSQSVGVYGCKVRVSELKPNGNLYILWVDKRGKQRKRSLGHRDRARGKKQALQISNGLAQRLDAHAEDLTLEKLVKLYLKEGLHGRSEQHKKECRRKLGLVRPFFGPERLVESLSQSDVDRYVDARTSGRYGPSVDGVSLGTVRHDLVALQTALNWAVKYKGGGATALLSANPLKGVELPREISPARPVAGPKLFEALLEVADGVNPKFRLALELAYATGHRIGAILHLRCEDISLAPSEHAPYGTIRWRAEHDKLGNEHVTPINKLAHEALKRISHERPGIGAAWVFPADTDPSQPVDRHLASRWFRKAEKRAGVEHVRGRGYHSFRRGWASARKHLPDVDVAAAGGWKDTASLKECYQHADPETVLRVVTAGEEGSEVIPRVIPPSETHEDSYHENAVGA